MDIISTSAFVLFLNVFSLKRVGCTLTELGKLSGTEGEEASFKWNSTIALMEASWGLCSSDLQSISSRFLLVEADGIPKYDDLDSSRYKDRVEFVGDTSKGHAWFVIKNLKYEDAVPYCANLAEGPKELPGITYFRNVTLEVNAAPTTPSHPTQTTTSTKTTPGSNITTNATVTEKPTSKKVIYNKGEKAELVFPLDVGNNKTWVNVTIYRNKDNTTSGEEKIIDLNKSDGVKNKYLSKREKDIDLAVQGTSNMVNVTFTLQNLKTTDAMFYRMSLVNSNFTTFSQYLYLEVSDCSPDCKEGESGGMTNAQKWGIGGGVTGTCVLIVVAGAAGRHYYKKNHNN